VVERTGGVPLFVEELTRAVLESGDAKLTGREIPATLHDSLMARLDRLGPAKELIQIGAVIGSEFSYELLHAVDPIAEEELQRALRTLADAELLYVRGIAPDATYQFKHALIRDAAYEPAIAAWTKAGKAATSRNAFAEALASYQQAVALITLLPESPERDNHELELRQPFVAMLQVTRGWAASETVEAAERMAALAERSGNLRQFAHWVEARAFTAWIISDLNTSIALANQALELRLREGWATGIANSHMQQVMTRYWLGDLQGAEKYFTAGLKFCDDPGFSQDKIGAPIAAFAFGSRNAWTLGRADVARERLVQMMAAANADNPHDIAFAGDHAAELWVLMREYEKAEALAERALALSEEYQFPNEAAQARCALGKARAQRGRTTEGIALIRQGIAGKLESGQRLGITRDLAFLAAAQASEGAIGDSLETIEQALQANPHELVWRPEIVRLRGELRLRQGDAKLAEADFNEAIALAQTMGAKAWELRATMSLARLLDNNDRRDEARTMLANIYNWFTEGFDTADLRDAKALLAELSGS
jgi:tetratricopeptide (TPR) repeat protein